MSPDFSALAPPRQNTGQWKMIYLARRNPALAADDFAQAWREHSALGRQCRNVQDKVLGVTQCTNLMNSGEDGGLRGTNADYDGVNLLQLRDLGVASDIWNDPETQTIMRPDEPRVFSTYVRDFTLVVQERVLCAQAPGDAVLVGFLRGLPALDTAVFLDTLAQVPSHWPQAGRVVLNVVEPERPAGYDFDAIVEWWFADADALRAALGPRDLREQLSVLIGALCQLDTAVFMATGVTHRRP
jgi:hypothetical protein